METNKIVIHNRGLSNVLFTSKFSKRTVFKHLLLIGYIVLITLIVFHFDFFKNAIQNAWNSNDNIILESSKVLQVAKSNSPIIIWDVFLVLIEIRLLKRTLKILHYSNRNVFVFSLFAICFFAYGIFIAVYLPSLIENKVSSLKDNQWIIGYKFLSEIFYYYLALPIASSLWYFANSLSEKNVSPYIAKNHFFRCLVFICWSLMIGSSLSLANMLLLGNNTVVFDYTNDLQMFLILSLSMLTLATFFGNLYISVKYKKSINTNFVYKNTVQAIAVALVVPIAIWLFTTYFKYDDDWMEWLYIVIVSIVLFLVVIYSLTSKKEFGSPRIFVVILSLSLTIIWMCKFFFEYLWGYQVNQAFTLPIAVFCSAVVFFVMYVKSPNSARPLLYLLSRFVKLLWIIVLSSWTIEFIPYVEKVMPFIPELINVSLMTIPILIFVCSIFYWYYTQWRIKSLAVIKIKKGERNV